jgi:hypothetical protein
VAAQSREDAFDKGDVGRSEGLILPIATQSLNCGLATIYLQRDAEP